MPNLILMYLVVLDKMLVRCNSVESFNKFEQTYEHAVSSDAFLLEFWT